ncbi:metallophosphoesterase [Nonlabens ponticola]|uniref:Metallophosphoesterase n=1 Tax=Nonlabens ponticola TaxID=2496866 RepID=A0A3S9MUR7_9FLAO|nr:metallophosphoesterase [Nonlabens ponticola]AZQ42924.1 metallophosphoesterase [Nonlabens ponticola]
MRWIITLLIVIGFQFYAFQLVRTLSRGHWAKWIYLAATILVILNIVLQFYLNPDRSQASSARDFAITLFLAVFVAQVVFVLFMLGEDIYRLIAGIWNRVTLDAASNSSFLPSRRKFLSMLGLGVAALPFGAIFYGAFKGKYDYQVRNYELSFDDLPEQFDGYTITQISDIHVGSFDDKEEVKYAIDLVNKQASDVILFTGDLVNNVSSELYGWEDIFSRLTASDGVFSVLGNHDYGDYASWETPEAKQANLQELFDIQKNMGWRLLLDENVSIDRGADSLKIVGVQNWGGGRFPKYGDLEKASQGLQNEDFKVLLSHDPTHWDAQVKENDTNFHLTLSGHTHGMQMGIEIPGWIKLSPAWFVYKKWAGIYKEYGRFLNVNRGFGFLGYSGRAGIWPEITVIKLKKRG